MAAKDKIQRAKIKLLLDQPFFGNLLLNLEIISDNNCETAYTDGKILGYNPDFIDSLPHAQVKTLLAHEVLHCVYQHHIRIKGRNHERWNEAADYQINIDLVNSRFQPIGNWLYNRKFTGMYTEKIYSLLQQDQQNQKNQKKKKQSRVIGEVRLAKQPEQQKSKWAKATEQAKNFAKKAGIIPGNMQEICEKTRPLDVHAIFQEFLEISAKNDYTFKRPNQRYVSSGYYLPSLYSQELGKIVIALDTSSSMETNDLTILNSFINSTLEQFQFCELEIIQCDTKIRKIETFTAQDLPVKLALYGRGGTSFKPVFDHVQDCTCLVYITDGYAKFPKAYPDYPVMWIGTKDNFNPPFGKFISSKNI